MENNKGFFGQLDRIVDLLNVVMLFTGGTFGGKTPENAPDFVKKAYGILGKDDEQELLVAIRLLDPEDQDLIMEFLSWLFTPADGDWVEMLEGMVKRNAFTSFLTKTFTDEETSKELKRIVADIKSAGSDLSEEAGRETAFTKAYARLRRPPIGCRRVGEWDVDWKGWLTSRFNIPEEALKANWKNAYALVKPYALKLDARSDAVQTSIIAYAQVRKERDAELGLVSKLIRRIARIGF